MVAWASQLMPPNVGDFRKPLRAEKPASPSWSSPRSRTVSIRGAIGESWTATRP